MSDGGKIENEIINYSVSRENKYNQPGNERTALMDDDSRISDSSKSGNEGNFSLPWNNFSSSNKNYYRDKILQTFPSYDSTLNSFILNSPDRHKFNYHSSRRFENCNYLKRMKIANYQKTYKFQMTNCKILFIKPLND